MNFIKNALVLFAYLFGGIMVIGFALSAIGEMFNIEEVNMDWWVWVLIVALVIGAIVVFKRR